VASISNLHNVSRATEQHMKNIYAGTSGWAYASWKPDFYPAKLASKNFLAHYATRLNSVEVNYTFRRFATQALLNRWIDATGPDFHFAMKAHQSITHIKRLRDAESPTQRFLESIEPLRKAKKLGPVLFQLPPYLKCDAGLLREFLAALPKWLRATFEFRHESWFNEDVYAALRNAGASMCLAESEKIESPDVQTAEFHYLRLRKPDCDLKEVERKARRLAESGPVYIYFKHEDTPEGALNAAALLERFK
jgi:uncharacterized protein YecE (DUF72 family)